MGEQGVQERAENAPSQRGEDFVTNTHHLGAARQKVQDPVEQGGVETQGLKLNDEFGWYYGVKF
jgi:hypothetical protein